MTGVMETIAGVATSIAAFVGTTKNGPINTPVPCLSDRDYERSFGGLDAASELSYAIRQFFANGGNQAIVVRIENAGNVEPGVNALDAVDLFNVLCLPGMSARAVLENAVDYCRKRRGFLIVDAPQSLQTPNDMLALIAGADLPRDDHAAVYYPWINVADPLRPDRPRRCAPSGTIAGLYARTDSTHGVWKAPTGADAVLNNIRSLAYPVTDAENAVLAPHAINCLRAFPVFGTVAWGARTLAGDNQGPSEWKYVPVRRTALFIEESLYRGLEWVIFEPNDEALWSRIRLNVGAFMQNLFQRGAFQGTTPRQAYFVKCDKQTTTQNDIDRGVLNVVVGFAPLKPAEFVIIELQQMAGQGGS